MATQPRRHRTDEELKGSAKHLLYEVQMLRGTCMYLLLAVPVQLLKNASLESFTSHARALLHFLYPEGKIDDDDVLAEDFFSDRAQWLTARGDKIPHALEKVRPRVAKEIVHLTYTRLSVTEEAKGWDPRGITNELNRKLKLFAENADRLDLDVKRELSRPESETRAAIQDP